DSETLRTLLDAVGGEPAILQDLADSFLADLDEQVAKLERALAGNDIAAVRRAAHSMKSTSASFGAAGLVGLSQGIEAAADGGEFPGEAKVAALKEQAGSVKSRLPTAIAGLAAGG